MNVMKGHQKSTVLNWMTGYLLEKHKGVPNKVATEDIWYHGNTKRLGSVGLNTAGTVKMITAVRQFLLCLLYHFDQQTIQIHFNNF